MKIKDGEREVPIREITVYDYFKQTYTEPISSAYFPCLDVGKPDRPNYLPLEVSISSSVSFVNFFVVSYPTSGGVYV